MIMNSARGNALQLKILSKLTNLKNFRANYTLNNFIYLHLSTVEKTYKKKCSEYSQFDFINLKRLVHSPQCSLYWRRILRTLLTLD